MKLRTLEELGEKELSQFVIQNTASRCLRSYDLKAWVALLSDGCSPMDDMDRDQLLLEVEGWEMAPGEIDELIRTFFKALPKSDNRTEEGAKMKGQGTLI